jgi:hypothetical protein
MNDLTFMPGALKRQRHGHIWFGYPTFWNNRQNATAEQFDVSPDGIGQSLNDLTSFLVGPDTRGGRVEDGMSSTAFRV